MAAKPTRPLPPVQGTLALEIPFVAEPVPRTPDLRVLRGGKPDEPPDPQPWAHRFVQAVVEVVAGDRPLQQMVRWTSATVYDDLHHRVLLLGQTSNADARVRTERSQVRSVRVCQPAADIAEIAAHVRHGPRSRAIAARLEAENGRWLCTALQFG
ncbi:MAG: hypothetical protein GEU96_16095 [Propionibacteriales bacterium]|nr:hypothetical protein [Propionibacteriales bacterium]